MKSASKAFKLIKQKKWQDIEYFDARWQERIKQMATFIEPGKKVLDLGCGRMWLRDYLSDESLYIPVDYIRRSDDCVVADFNKQQFPEINTDIAFVSGCLEYVKDYTWFIECITKCSKQVIISYCATNEFPRKKLRRQYYWINHLSAEELINLFISSGFSLQVQTKTNDNNRIFFFINEKKQ